MSERSIFSVTDWYKLRNFFTSVPFNDQFKDSMHALLSVVTPLHGPHNAVNKTPAGHCLETLYYDEIREIFNTSVFRPGCTPAFEDLFDKYCEISNQTKGKYDEIIMEHRVIDWFFREILRIFRDNTSGSVNFTVASTTETETNLLPHFEAEFNTMRNLTNQLNESHVRNVLQQSLFNKITVDDSEIKKHITNRWILEASGRAKIKH
ncbi:hypothetical protein DOLIC_00149 [Dolichomitus sp. PSUC_FEM 10030005]|nr:hypothetical protein [Dolichomitus sp. PSUC_FEM 10030005]